MSPTLRCSAVAAITVLGSMLSGGSASASSPVAGGAEDPSGGAVRVVRSPPRPLAPRPHRIAWLNAWADHHTAPGGDRASALDGADRMGLVVAHLRRTAADLAVLAEVEAPQRDAFDRLAGAEFGQVRSADALDDVVVYRRSVFSLVSAAVFTLRYQGGSAVRTPVVVLAERATGNRVAVIPVHLPASTPAYRDQQRWRAADLTRLAEVVRGLDLPVIVAGDFNEHRRPLCDLASVGLVSPVAPAPGCPAVTPPIDQALFSPSLEPAGYDAYRGPDVSLATDHGSFYDATFTLNLSGFRPR